MSAQKLVHVLSFRGLLSPTHGHNTSFTSLNKRSAPYVPACIPYTPICGNMHPTSHRDKGIPLGLHRPPFV